MTPDGVKALIAEARHLIGTTRGPGNFLEWSRRDHEVMSRLADALEVVYDAGRRELAERFASQDKTRKAAIEELMAWEDEHEALSAHPAEETDQIKAIARLIELAKDRIETIDGEWGCCHSFDEAVAGDCSKMRDDAAEVVALVAALSAHPAEETEWEFEVVDGGGYWQSDVPDNDPSWFDPADWPDGHRLMRRRKAAIEELMAWEE